ncbi:MAG: HNH endonuclease [Actinomycetota bacterium]
MATDVIAAMEVLGAADVACADPAACAVLLGEVRRVRGWLDATEARVTSRLNELSAALGTAPAADVHVRASGVSAGEGRRKERRADTLTQVPVFAEALSAGQVGTEHVDALAAAVAVLDDDTRTALFDRDLSLLGIAMHSTPEQFGRHVRSTIRTLELCAGVERNLQQRRDTYLTRRHNPATGMVEGRFALHPELASQIFTAVDREVAAMLADGERRLDPEYVNRTVNRNRLAAEALGTLVAGGHQQRRPLEADITVIIDGRTLATGHLHPHSVCETGDGFDLPPSSVQRLFCAGSFTPIIVRSDGTVLDAGRTIRSANRTQRRALRAMYRTCAAPECDVPFHRCEIHHIHWYQRGGPTNLDNLIPLCSRHHHLVHDLGWHLHLAPDRTLTITPPNGTPTSGTPPSQARPDLATHLTPRPPPDRQPAA